MSEAPKTEAFFAYDCDRRFAPIWGLAGVRSGTDGVTVTDSVFRATFGRLKLETSLDNVRGGHVTEDYRWWTAVGPRLSMADDGLTFGTNADRGVCVHFVEPVKRVIGFKNHSALTVTVQDCDGLLKAIGED